MIVLDVIGAVLTNATAIAISPVPIIAVILMLMSPRAGRLGYTFLIGWFVGVVIATTVFSLVAGVIPEPSESGSQPVAGVIALVLGLGLLFLGWKQWRSRPAPGTEATLPAWMSKITDMRPGAAFVLALGLAALNPKNLLLSVAAGGEIGRADLDAGQLVVVIGVFSLLASLTVLIPVLFTTFAPRTAATALNATRDWLTANNAVIMMVVFVILGAKVIGNGLAAF